MRLKNLLTLSAAFGAVIGAVACGDSTDPETGVFIDSEVEGLRYVGPTWTGRTNAAGEYRYDEGDEVCFYLDQLLLGCTPGRGIVTPIDLFEDAEADDEEVLNVVRLLLALDADGDPSNGIDVSAVEIPDDADIDFEQSETDFGNDSDVSDLVAEQGNEGGLPDAEEAEDHFDESLEESNYYAQGLEGAWTFTFFDFQDNVVLVEDITWNDAFVAAHSIQVDEEWGDMESYPHPEMAGTCEIPFWYEEMDVDGAPAMILEGYVTCQEDGYMLLGMSRSPASTYSIDDLSVLGWGGLMTVGSQQTSSWELDFAFLSAQAVSDAMASVDASGNVQFTLTENNGLPEDAGANVCTFQGKMGSTKDLVMGSVSCDLAGDGLFFVSGEELEVIEELPIELF